MNEYQSMNDYYDTKKQDEQEYVIDSTGTNPLIATEGTKIWLNKSQLVKPNGDTITWPYTVKVIELYPAKDMLYYQMPTVGGGNLLTSHGEVKITVFKDGEELSLKSGASWRIEMPNSSPISGMKTYYGNGTSIVDWINPTESFATSSYGYDGFMSVFGWISCAKDPNFSSTDVNYTFTSTTDNLTTVSKFIYFPDSKGLMQLYSNSASNLPDGENIKILFIGIDGSNQLFHYFSDTDVSSSSNSVNVTMTAISDADLTTILDNL